MQEVNVDEQYGTTSAWRARQNAQRAALQLDEQFKEAITEALQVSGGDLQGRLFCTPSGASAALHS